MFSSWVCLPPDIDRGIYGQVSSCGLEPGPLGQRVGSGGTNPPVHCPSKNLLLRHRPVYTTSFAPALGRKKFASKIRQNRFQRLVRICRVLAHQGEKRRQGDSHGLAKKNLLNLHVDAHLCQLSLFFGGLRSMDASLWTMKAESMDAKFRLLSTHLRPTRTSTKSDARSSSSTLTSQSLEPAGPSTL